MKKIGLAIILAFFIMITIKTARAESHSPEARIITLASLQYHVEETCWMWKKIPLTNCAKLAHLVQELYKNPNIASQKDLQILEEMDKYGLKVTGARSNLAEAIAQTKKVFAHVVGDHNGVWQENMCLPEKS